MVLHMDMYGRPKFRMRLVWLFGLVSKEIRRGRKKPEEPERVTEKKQKRRAGRIGARTIFQILRTKGLLRQFTRLLKEIFGRIKIRDVAADFTVGLGDPADTGLLFAIIGPITFFLTPSFAQRIRVQPSFEDETVFQGYLGGTMRLQPIQLVPPFLRFTFSLATMRAVKTLVLTKWKRK
jgi:hypothetical protein